MPFYIYFKKGISIFNIHQNPSFSENEIKILQLELHDIIKNKSNNLFFALKKKNFQVAYSFRNTNQDYLTLSIIPRANAEATENKIRFEDQEPDKVSRHISKQWPKTILHLTKYKHFSMFIAAIAHTCSHLDNIYLVLSRFIIKVKGLLK